MIKYPDGSTYNPKKNKIKKNKIDISISSSNRGMDFEDEINASNEYYKLNSIALITKRPTPINVVKVDYSKGSPKIVDAYFEKQSTTDYNGVYKGKYIDFEAKSTKNKTSFPLANIPLHQINHLKNVLKNDGIAFFLIKFVSLQEIYFVDAKYVISFYETSTRKSIPYKEIVRFGYRIVENFNPRIDFISIIDKHFIK